MKWIGSVLEGVKNLLKVSIVGIMLLIFFISLPIFCFWILYQTMPEFGFLAFFGGLFILIGLLLIIGFQAYTFRNMFYRSIKDWGVKTNEKEAPTPTVKETYMFLIITFLCVISGAILMILEILMKSE